MCCIKAKEFHSVVARKMGMTPLPFKASKGWAQNFFRRHGFKYKKTKGEELSSDTVAAKEYPEILRKMLEDDGYTRDQVFNADETALFWKKMPDSTYISQETKRARGMKPIKSRFSLLLACNASGTCKLKPLVLHTARNPRAYKNIGADQRGVFWRSNKKAWMTAATMNEWFDDMFVPSVRDFCEKKNIDFKCILLLDNAPGHAKLLADRHPSVKVVFLPARTTSLIQPLDQELIGAMKASYYRRTFLAMEQATEVSTEEFVAQAEADEEAAVAGKNVNEKILLKINV